MVKCMLSGSPVRAVQVRSNDGRRVGVVSDFEGDVAARCHGCRRSHLFAGQLAGLLHPCGELSFIELVLLVDVEVARVLALAGAGRTGRSDVPRKKATLT